MVRQLKSINEALETHDRDEDPIHMEAAEREEEFRVVKIAPGEQAMYWDECRANGYICVGWDDVGDLRNYDSREALRDRFREEYSDSYNNHVPTLTRKAGELWTLRELEAGDVVVANKGTSRILALGTVIDPGYEWRPERATFKHTVAVKWDPSYEQEIPKQTSWGMATVAAVPVQLYQSLLSGRPGRGPRQLPMDPLFSEIADALESKGQAILYGPPGTGKTYQARRFAVWWLLQHQGETDPMAAVADAQRLAAVERTLTSVEVARRVWWMVANPATWRWEQLFDERTVEFDHGRLQRNFALVQAGDLVIGYQSTPDKRIAALARVTRGIYDSPNGESTIELEPVYRIRNGPTYAELLEDTILKNAEPLRFRCQGTLFALTSDEAEYVLAMLSESNPDVNQFVTSEEDIGPLTWITFHPSYSYEDFIEGFRPVDTGGDALVLRLEDGLFKRICRRALLHPKDCYLLVVDEINRANMPKVFGELITLLEKDKRGLTVTLPQSRERFTIPANVYLLGTMNTADRSIRLLDSAVRRRFAFVEVMPDAKLLDGATIGMLALDEFLERLNQTIVRREGREKQIGHALLLDDGQPISGPGEFARRFRQEILPLLQEYCYDDFATLALYLGDRIVDSQEQKLKDDVLFDPGALIQALASHIAEGVDTP